MSTGVKQQLKAETEFGAIEDRFSESFRLNPQPMSIKAMSDGRFIDVNDSFLSMSGYTRDELVGRTTASSGSWAEPESLNTLVEQLNRRGTIHNCETRFRTKDGRLRTLLSSIELVNYRGESCMLIASNDVTEQNELEEQTDQDKRRFLTLVDNSSGLIWCLNRDLHVTFVSSSLERAVGLGEKEILGLTLRDLPQRVSDWKKVEELSTEVLQSGQLASLDFVYNGRNRRIRVIPEPGRNGATEAVMCIDEDITDQMRSDDELLRLTARLFNMQDEERRRIARELHDGMAQNLFAITINLARLQQHHSIPSLPDVRDALEDCQSLCEQSLQEIRTLSYLLHPPLLDQAGLFSALQWYVEGFTRRTGIYVDLVELQDIGRLPSDIETALFRVVQECLTNICRHSGSDTASILLEKRRDRVLLRIRDQGQGMAITDESPSDDHIGELGVGIPGMRQRLKQLGGRLEIMSGNQGTTIVAEVPVDTGARHDYYSAG